MKQCRECHSTFSVNRFDQIHCPQCRHTIQIMRHRRCNARARGVVPDEGYMALQQAKADGREQTRLARLAVYEAYEARKHMARAL